MLEQSLPARLAPSASVPVATVTASVASVASRGRRIEAEATARLRTCGHPSLGRVACACAGETLILSGRLSSFFLKQAAQETVRRIDGVTAVDNRVKVESLGPNPR